MKMRPILFSGPMVRALLDGSKTQTRRVVKPPKGGSILGLGGPGIAMANMGVFDGCMHVSTVTCPYGQPGDRLWVRETWAYGVHAMASARDEDGPFVYAADGTTQGRLCERWRPSIHMPRAASRITLEITGVRVERLQDISVADALAEGVNVHPDHHNRPRTSRYSPVQAYRDLWEQINGPSSWDANPWVWVVEFKRVEGFAA